MVYFEDTAHTAAPDPSPTSFFPVQRLQPLSTIPVQRLQSPSNLWAQPRGRLISTPTPMSWDS